MKFELFGYVIDIEKKALKDEKMPEDLRQALEIIKKYGAKVPPSEKKIESAKAAAAVKAKTAKEKVNKAIQELREEKKEITPYKVAKKAGISYNTAKKYINSLS
jgi:response regulator of citrate/malate metabolism